MKKLFFQSIFILSVLSCGAQSLAIKKNNIQVDSGSYHKIKVLTLGSFHFDFPNLDVAKVDKDDQIDVFDDKYQTEIALLVRKLAEFKPTKIVIERQPEKQELYDSLYISYINGNHNLTRSEEQQIGFRLGKKLGLTKLYCVDSWSNDYEELKEIFDGNDSIEKKTFMDYFYHNPDSLLNPYRNERRIFKTKGIIPELIRLNSQEELTKGLGSYLIGIFKYETEENTQLGPDFVTSWWFNRNLRIFRNIQRIKTKPTDRILVIFGAGHMNLLNILFEASPEYDLLKVNDYLK